MSLLDSRQSTADAILQGRFIRSVSQDTAKDIDQSQRKYMSSRGFEGNDWYSGRSFIATTDGFEYTHLKKHRFVDMKYWNTKKGRTKRKPHPIHNKIIWNHYNNMIKELHFGFTEAVKHQLRNME
jgi:hypothetical protein